MKSKEKRIDREDERRARENEGGCYRVIAGRKIAGRQVTGERCVSPITGLAPLRLTERSSCETALG